MKTLKKLFGTKNTYAIPSDNGDDITKGKKYKIFVFICGFPSINDNTKTRILINPKECRHINGGSWEIITE